MQTFKTHYYRKPIHNWTIIGQKESLVYDAIEEGTLCTENTIVGNLYRNKDNELLNSIRDIRFVISELLKSGAIGELVDAKIWKMVK